MLALTGRAVVQPAAAARKVVGCRRPAALAQPRPACFPGSRRQLNAAYHGQSASSQQRASCRRLPAAAAAAVAAPQPAANDAAAPEAQQPPQQQQQQQQPSLSLTDLWLLLRHDWVRLAVCVSFTALSVACAVMVAPALGVVVDTISRGTAATPHELAVAVGRLGAVYIISNCSLAVQVALSLALGESMAHRLRCRLFDALLHRDPLFFDSVKTGQMVAWLGQDIEVLQSTVAKLLGARGIRSAFETTGIIIVLFTLSWPLAVALLVSAPLLTPLIAQLGRRIGTASKASQAAANEVSSAANEVVENMRVVKLFAQQHRELTRFRGLLESAHQLALKVLRLQALLDASSRVRNTLCVLCTLGLGAWMALNNTVSLGTCYSFFVFSFSFAFALGNLTNTVGDVAKAAGAVSRAMRTMQTAMGADSVAEVVAADAVVVTPSSSGSPSSNSSSSSSQNGSGPEAGAEASTSGRQLEAGQPAAHIYHRQLPIEQFQGHIELRNVSFSHPGWSGWTLDGISFTIPAGKKVALVGPSGGGKSTVASMLMGLYPPAQGEILVDGVPLQELDMQWWRRQLGVVSQEPGLLTGSIADIIRYGQPAATDSEVEWAARAAQAHDFICELPQGYQTVIGAGSGVELSGGQRQRLAIARALLPRPRVLIFDEATSALDVQTEQRVTQALESAGQGVTSLIIAHRLSTVRRADAIVVVAAGKVVEVGTHEQLMAQRGGVYWSLVSSAESKGQDEWDAPAAGDDAADGATEQQELAAAA